MKSVTEPDRTRSGVVFDIALAVGLAIFGVIGTYFASSQQQPLRRPFDAGAAVLVVVGALALVARRRNPVVVLAVVFGPTLLYFLTGYRDGPIWFPLIVAYTTAAVSGHRLAAAIVGVSGFLLFPWMDFFLRDGPAPSASRAPRARRLAPRAVRRGRDRRGPGAQRIAEAARMEEEESLRRAERGAAPDRARELHDALGHHLSLISVQAGVALHVNQALPEQARTSLAAIRDASKEALTELRSVLDILRERPRGEARASPRSTLARIERSSPRRRRRPAWRPAPTSSAMRAHSRTGSRPPRSGNCPRRP